LPRAIAPASVPPSTAIAHGSSCSIRSCACTRSTRPRPTRCPHSSTRSAPAPPPCRLELATDPVPHLRVVDAESAADPQAAAGVADQILTALAAAPVPLSRDDLRAALRTRNATLGDALIRLRAEGRIERCPGGFRLRPPAPSAIPVPPTTAQRERNTAS